MDAITRRARRKIIQDLIDLMPPVDSRHLWGDRSPMLPEHLYSHCSLSANENMSYDVLADYPTMNWDWTALSAVDNGITMHDFLANRDKPWNWTYVACRAETMEKVFEILPPLEWADDDKYTLWTRGPVTMDNIINNELCLSNKRLAVPADYIGPGFYLSRNPNIRIDTVLANHGWNYCELSRNAGIKFEDVMQHFNLGWCMGCLSRNPNVRMQNVRDHAYLNWNYRFLSRNKTLTLSDVLNHCIPTEYPEIPAINDRHVNGNMTDWHWPSLSKNMKVSMKQIIAHPDLPWDWDGLSQNENIRLSDVRGNLNLPWNMSYVMANPFIHDRDEYIEKYTREHMAALRIQLRWRKIATDPSSLVCHRIQSNRIKKNN